MKTLIQGIPSAHARHLLAGGLDANGQPALRRTAQGKSNPCRHCLQLVAEGDEKLVLSYRPFAHPQPYAETGPLFLHGHDCPRYEAGSFPPWFAFLTPAIVRGYGQDDWILYETGGVVAGTELQATCGKILSRPEVAYVHVRSRFNCFQCRVDRA